MLSHTEATIQTAYGPRTAEEAAKADRSRQLIQSLGAAELTLAALVPSLRRAVSNERRSLDRKPGLVRTETRIALRLARDLVRQLERAADALPVEG